MAALRHSSRFPRPGGVIIFHGALSREFDDVEPQLAPALAGGGIEIADSRLADPELSPSSLAR